MVWPPPSPDITPLDFYVWGYVKQHVYSERINDINHLKQRITDVIHSVTPHVLTRVWEELDYRLDVCSATNGAPALNSCECMLMIPEGQQSYFRSMSLYTLKKSKINEDPL
ncbi:hypothetical protein AVEN_265090-1 [Araneus ventricosus]|uniref:Uncharacterized protein n=1 Tax=Araneus ventricosus TaxID=182803 RepID=A0A4Y2U2R5_ARAVE|nr:hypothetical protein AVEN_265090-1 [Araneus ventricosus]